MRTVVLALCFAACTSAQSTGIPPVTCPTDSTLTYANFGASFIADNCGSCHSTMERPALTSQAAIVANGDKILEQAVYTDAMPKSSNMTTQQRELLGEWLACGAP